MSVLTDEVLKGKKDPSLETLKLWTIRGGSEVIQEKLKERGWDVEFLVSSLRIHFNQESKVTNVQLFLSGFKPVGRVTANILWGDTLNQDNYAKFESVDMSLTIICASMVSADKTDWVLKVVNQETKKMRVINKLDEDSLKACGATKINLRAHVALDKGIKLTVKLGMVPVTNVLALVGNGAMNFPFIQLEKESKVDILPVEDKYVCHGLGFEPFLIYQGSGELPVPNMLDVRGAITEFFNNACKAKTNTKFSTWKNSAALRIWDVVEPIWIWLTSTVTGEDDEQGEKFSSQSRNKEHR